MDRLCSALLSKVGRSSGSSQRVSVKFVQLALVDPTARSAIAKATFSVGLDRLPRSL
ncbi:MAG: hypothetical protein ABSH31_02510 [Bryobacteraceae bacterium]|jgi:hypothetical protein